MERYFSHNYFLVALWGMGVLLGMIGLGRLVARIVGQESAKNAGWGLHAVWGASLYLFLGSLLAAFSLCGEGMITLLIGIGLAVMLWTTWRGGRPTRAALAALPWKMWPAVLVVALKYAGGLCWQVNVNTADDLPAYYSFCEKLLASGSFPDPFSWRRLASLGGQTLLQCSILVHASYANIQAFEIALGPVILLGLILGFRRGALAKSRLGVFVALVAVTTPILRVNTASSMTGVMFALGLFATLDLVELSEAGRLRLLAVAGAVAAGLCSLRAQYVPAACGAVFIYWLGSWVKQRKPPRRALLEAGCIAAAVLVALLPWMIMAVASNGSPLFPLFQGDNNLAFNPQSAAGSLLDRMRFPAEMVFQIFLTPLLLCLLANPEWRRGLPSWALSLAAFAASMALAYSVNLAPDNVTVPRYVQPILLPAAFAALMTGALSPRCRMTVWITGLILVTTSFTERSQNLLNHFKALSDENKVRLPIGPYDISDYRKAQLLIPEGKRIFVCCDFPFLFDHARNPIWIVDLPHAASPSPGLPFKKTPDETKRYLHGLGLDYAIFTEFHDGQLIYDRALWERYAVFGVPLFKIQAPFYLDFFATADQLSATEKVLGRKGRLTALQLSP